MEAVLSFMKNFLILTLILFIFSYLVPKESYQKYFQFFIGIFMTVILLAPVADWMFSGSDRLAYKSFDQIIEQLDEIKWDEKNEKNEENAENGEDIFGIFGLDKEGS